MKFNLSNLNLNLLVALDALIKEQSVTGASLRLNLTQSAVSNILKQLREVFNNEILIRGQSGKMVATEFALQVAPQLSQILNSIESLIEKRTFDYLADSASFKVAISDYAGLMIVPELTAKISKLSSRLNITYVIQNHTPCQAELEDQNIDLVIGIFNSLPANLYITTLYEEHIVCVACESNTKILNDTISMEDFVSNNRLLVTTKDLNIQSLQSSKIISQLGYKRQPPQFIFHDIHLALLSLVNTDMVYLTYSKIAQKLQSFAKINFCRCPFEYPDVKVQLIWQRKNNSRLDHQWLRDFIKQNFSLINNG